MFRSAGEPSICSERANSTAGTSVLSISSKGSKACSVSLRWCVHHYLDEVAPCLCSKLFTTARVRWPLAGGHLLRQAYDSSFCCTQSCPPSCPWAWPLRPAMVCCAGAPSILMNRTKVRCLHPFLGVITRLQSCSMLISFQSRQCCVTCVSRTVPRAVSKVRYANSGVLLIPCLVVRFGLDHDHVVAL